MSAVGPKNDWSASFQTYLAAWGISSIILLAAILLPVGQRAVVWTAVLVWMGTGCLLNARRCGRTHCRYTGPFYLVMIIPVAALGTGTVVLGALDWWALAALILLGSKLIWLPTEWAWGRYRS